MNEKRACREEVGEGIRRLGVIRRSRRKQGRAFWRGNSICKGRMLRKEVKHLWESEGAGLSVECYGTKGPIYQEWLDLWDTW